MTDPLTKRERLVRDQVCAGSSSKEIGITLDISPRTVEVYRISIRKKYGARNTADLVRMVLSEQITPKPQTETA